MSGGVRLRLEYDDLEARKRLEDALARGEDLRPLFRQVGVWMAFKSVEKTFRARGRPKKWEPLHEVTLALRRWREKKFGRPDYTEKVLEVSGDLRKNWGYQVRPDHVDIGSHMEYADTHQFGKTLKAPKWMRGKGTVRVGERRLIEFHPDDLRQCDKFADAFLEKLI